MNTFDLIDALPIWGIFIIFLFIIHLCTELGFRLGQRARHTQTRIKKIRTGPGVTATLGLLAFMLAFTFSTVTSRYDQRKQLVLDEANVIGTAYLRADLMPEVEADQIRRILREYIDIRLEIATSKDKKIGSKIKSQIVRTKEIQAQLWAIAVDQAARDPSPVTALFLQSLNDVIDLHMKRVTVALHHRMPSIFWKVLLSLTIFAMIVGGYDSGLIGGRRSTTSILSVSLSFGVVLMLIVALERPEHKLSRVTQGALIELQQDISPYRTIKP